MSHFCGQCVTAISVILFRSLQILEDPGGSRSNQSFIANFVHAYSPMRDLFTLQDIIQEIRSPDTFRIRPIRVS